MSDEKEAKTAETVGRERPLSIDYAWAVEVHGRGVPEVVDTIVVGAGAAGCVLAGHPSRGGREGEGRRQPEPGQPLVRLARTP